MKRLALLALLVVLVPSAHAAGCSPLNCSPSQFVVAHGALLATRATADQPLRVIDLRTGATRWRLPTGVVSGNTLVSLSPGLVTWYDLATGKRLRAAPVQVNGTFELAGVSQDGSQAVLARTQSRSTTFAILTRTSQRVVRLGGNDWQFDALNGQNLFLIQQLKNGYEVRLYDLASNTLQQQPLKDQDESALIQGVPFQRMSSPNGRYLFTLYINGNGGAMIHELDTAAGRAYCIDLPGSGDYNAAMTWAIAPTNARLWAVSVGYGRIAEIDVVDHALAEHATFNRATWTANAGVAALAPDHKSLVVTDAQHTWFASLESFKVRRGPDHVAIAIAFSPDGSRVWGVGLRSKVFALRVNR